jgi:hypothetical protein
MSEELIYEGLKIGAYDPPVFIHLMNAALPLYFPTIDVRMSEGTPLGEFVRWKICKTGETAENVNVIYDGIDPGYWTNGKIWNDRGLKERSDTRITIRGQNSKLLRFMKDGIQKTAKRKDDWWFV